MLLAIDTGNTHTVYGLWDGSSWRAIWRRSTNADDTEDQLGVWLKGVHELSGIEMHVDSVIVASVVPQMDRSIALLANKWLGVAPKFLRAGADVGLTVDYDPPHAVGADRIANALGALAKYQPPIVVVDFGTATTFDTINREGVYVGGAILPGVEIASNALIQNTAKLPQIDLTAPSSAIGKNTVHSLQSGIMLGYAGAIDALAVQIDKELGGGSTIVSTGGLGHVFSGLTKTISKHDETLTLEGLVIAFERLR